MDRHCRLARPLGPQEMCGSPGPLGLRITGPPCQPCTLVAEPQGSMLQEMSGREARWHTMLGLDLKYLRYFVFNFWGGGEQELIM